MVDGLLSMVNSNESGLGGIIIDINSLCAPAMDYQQLSMDFSLVPTVVFHGIIVASQMYSIL
jgi:hypothetical protein